MVGDPELVAPTPGPPTWASLIDFPSLAAYERYREALAADPEHTEVAKRAAEAGVILVEDRSFVQRAASRALTRLRRRWGAAGPRRRTAPRSRDPAA